MLALAVLSSFIFGGSVLVTELPDAKQPQLSVSDTGRIDLVFGRENDLLYVKSSDWGVTYEQPREIGKAGVLALGMRRGPRISAYKDRLVVTAVYGERGGGQDGDVLAWVSRDAGMTWKGPSRVSDVAAAGREGLIGTAVSRGGKFGCAWLDLRTGKTEIWCSTSTDGVTWTQNRLVYRSPSGSVCECCHPSVAFQGDDLCVMFRNSIDGRRDMYLARSVDGVTFNCEKLGTGSWKLDACPMDGGALSIDGKSIRTVWRRGNEVFTCRPSERETKLGEGMQPCSAGAYTCWLSRRGGPLLLSDGRTTSTLSQSANDPQMASSPNGRWVVATWEETGTIRAQSIRR